MTDRRILTAKQILVMIAIPLLFAAGGFVVNNIYANIDKKVDKSEYDASIKAMLETDREIKEMLEEIRADLHSHEINSYKRYQDMKPGNK